MKDMLSTITRRSFAANRVRNIITALAIALTATLFTSVTTIGAGTLQSMTLTAQQQKMSRSDAEIRNMTIQQFEALQNADFAETVGLRMPVGFLTNSSRHNIEFDVMDETQAWLTFSTPTHGTFPQAENEVAASDRALCDLGVEPEVGAEITVEFTAHGKDYSLPMVVSGWYEAVNDQVSYMIAGTAFRDAHPDIFENTFRQDGELAGTYFSDILAGSTFRLQEELDEFSRSQGGDPDDMQAADYLPGIINRASSLQIDGSILGIGVFFVLLFVFCCYLLIYNVFDIAVMQDIRRYGLYRTIGMGKKQVKRIINRQAVWLSCIGIPIGLFGGFFIGKSTLPVIMSMFGTEYGSLSADVSPSSVIFAAAVVLTAFTVFLSTRKPVRIASGIPPLEAFRYVESGMGKRTQKRSADYTSLTSMALANLGRNKRRTLFIVVSLMLCVVLLNCVGTLAVSLDEDKVVSEMIRTDFAVLNVGTMNNRIGFTTRDMALSVQTIEDISEQPGVTDAAPVYKNTLEDTNVTYQFDIVWEAIESSYKTGLAQGVTADKMFFSLGDDGNPICNVYGMEKGAIERMILKEGETDAQALYEKMQDKKGVLLGILGQMGTADYSPFTNVNILDVGDIITVYKNGKPVMELPILAKAVLNGDDVEIGYTREGANRVGGDGLFLYFPTSVYKELYDEPAVYKYSFNTENEEAMTAFLDNYMDAVDTGISYMSSKSARAGAAAMKNMIYFVGGIVGVIFGLAGILNLVNMLITSIITRRHEFATMRSIGMTDRQLSKMLTYEGVFYALGAVFFGLLLSVLFDMTLVRTICEGMWQFTFRMTLVPALITSTLLLLFAAAVPTVTLRLFNKGSIVEQLRIIS